MRSPVVLVVFNRPATTARVLEAIRAARPPRLFIVGDGARADRPGEAERVDEVRRLVERGVDWPCEVTRDYAEVNLGCGRRIASGLDAVFRSVPEAIVLEDDCLPHPSFFGFCEALLERYRDDARVMHIGGDNFQPGPRARGASYYFSRWAHCWGWATWRRAWTSFDLGLTGWPRVRDEGWLADVLPEPRERAHWSAVFDGLWAERGAPRTWGYAWAYACLLGGVSVVPDVNLVSNIGFGPDGTHCSDPTSPVAARGLGDIGPPERLRHPPVVAAHAAADRWTFERVFRPPGLRARARRRLAGLVRRWTRS